MDTVKWMTWQERYPQTHPDRRHSRSALFKEDLSINSAANQERVANNYVSSRYGSWAAAQSFWQANGWY